MAVSENLQPLAKRDSCVKLLIASSETDRLYRLSLLGSLFIHILLSLAALISELKKSFICHIK